MVGRPSLLKSNGMLMSHICALVTVGGTVSKSALKLLCPWYNDFNILTNNLGLYFL